MGFIPLYLVEDDVSDLLALLGEDEEIAFIVRGDTKGTWRAVPRLENVTESRYALWHVPS